MASESLTLARAREREGGTILETLHDWAVTVDHKRLGILYIVYGIVFLAIGGLEAAIMRIQLMIRQQRLRHAPGLQPHDDHARHHDGLPRGRAHPLRLRQLPRAADDRRAGHGLPAPQRPRLLAHRVRRLPSLLQLHRRRGARRSGQRPRRRVVRLRAPDREGVLPRPQHRLLDARHPPRRLRHRGHGRQHRHHRHLPCAARG